jgi:cobalt-zinc-cadmium efflux system outer membrane protein
VSRHLLFAGTLAAFLTASLTLPFLSFAQAPGRAVSMVDAVSEALDQNPALRATSQGVLEAKANLLGLGRLVNPDLSLIGDAIEQSLEVRQPLLLGNQLALEQEIAQSDVDLAALEVGKARLELRVAVEQAYGRLVVADERTKLSQEGLALARSMGELADKRFRAGDVPRLEVMQADAVAQAAASEFEQDRLQADVEQASVAALLGASPVSAIRATDPVALSPMTLAAPGVLLERANRNNPQLLAAAVAAARAVRVVMLAEARRLPGLGATVGVRRNSNDSAVPLLRAGIDFPLPLWNQQQGPIAVAQAELTRARLQQAATERQVASAIASNSLQAGRAQAKLMAVIRTRLPIAKSLLELSRRAYREGATGILGVLEAQRNWQQARLDYLDAVASYRLAITEIERQVGDELR